jgi:hypothetical protein
MTSQTSASLGQLQEQSNKGYNFIQFALLTLWIQLYIYKIN